MLVYSYTRLRINMSVEQHDRMSIRMSTEQIKTNLATYGYCIVPGVLVQEEIDYCKGEFKAWQKTIPNHDKMHRAVDPHGIYKYHYAGHTRHGWRIRTRPEVQKVYQDIWNTDELNVSFDGCCYISKDTRLQDKCWTHTDQAPNSIGAICYQGFVSLTNNKERTLVVYEGSHLLHEKYFADRGIVGTKNWQRIDDRYLETIADTKRVLNVPAGALVLWESRTFHQNQYGAPNSEERLIQYVCYLPKSHIKNTPAMIKKRAKYLEEGRTTSHWPSPLRVNGLQPQTYGDMSRTIDYSLVKRPDVSDMYEDILKLV